MSVSSKPRMVAGSFRSRVAGASETSETSTCGPASFSCSSADVWRPIHSSRASTRPAVATRATTMAATHPAKKTLPGVGTLKFFGSSPISSISSIYHAPGVLCAGQVDCLDLGVALMFADHVTTEDRIHGRHHEQGHHRRREQSADYGAPQRSILLGTRAERKRHREHPENPRERGHDDRAEADAAGLDSRGERTIAFLAQLVGESDQQVGVGDADTYRHDRAHQRFDVDGRTRYREHPEHAGQRSRPRINDDERLEPRLKVRDHQQVHEDDGQDESLAKGEERVMHRLALAADDDVRAGG